MLEKSFGMYFFLKHSKNETNGRKFVYVRITVDGVPKEISTKMKWTESRWDHGLGRAIGTKEDARVLNEYIDSLVNKVHNTRKKLLDDSDEVSVEELCDAVKGRTNRKTILQVFQNHNDQMEALVDIDFARGTLDRYATSYDHTKAFMVWRYDVNDMDIRKLDYYFIEQYSFWLKTVKKCNHNTTMKYLANFKKVVLICVKNQWLPGDPFANFKLTKRDVDKEPLLQWELDKIGGKDFGNERLNNVRDVFIFSCYTGLAYADVKKLKRSDIRNGMDDSLWIFASRQKTDTPFKIPLLSPALKIIDRYKDHPKCINEDKVLAVLSNQKMNAYLKEIAYICGIQNVLTFHLARHTFATTVTLGNGVPIETVSKMLGHTTLKQTQHYAKILEHKISEDMTALKDRLENTIKRKAEENVEMITPEKILHDKQLENIETKVATLNNFRRYNYVLV